MLTEKIKRMTGAMILFEGWYPSGEYNPGVDYPSVSYRNHNPGNLRESIFALGKRDGFAYFYNDATGRFALEYDIMEKCLGETVTSLTPESPISELIKVYSCASGKTLEHYIAFVCNYADLNPSMPIGQLVK